MVFVIERKAEASFYRHRLRGAAGPERAGEASRVGRPVVLAGLILERHRQTGVDLLHPLDGDVLSVLPRPHPQVRRAGPICGRDAGGGKPAIGLCATQGI